jgi:hypothetical protein
MPSGSPVAGMTDRRDPALIVEMVLTDSEKRTIDMATRMLYPKLAGAGVADVLALLGDADKHLFWTEDLFLDNRQTINDLTREGVNVHLWDAAMQAAIMKGPLFEEVLRIVRAAQEVLDQDGDN